MLFIMNWEDRISADPKILVGKPIIRGTRLSVEFILDLLASRWTEQQILEYRNTDDERLFLENPRYAEALGLGIACQLPQGALYLQRAGVSGGDPGQDIEQRGFAGAVLANQSHDAVQTERDIDLVKRHGFAKALAQSRRAQHLDGCCRSVPRVRHGAMAGAGPNMGVL